MTSFVDQWLVSRPTWATPVRRLRWHWDGLRALWAALRTGHHHARPVGPYGWTARRIAVFVYDDETVDRLALFHPKSSNAPYVQFDDTLVGRRRFMWACYRYAYDRNLSRFE